MEQLVKVPVADLQAKHGNFFHRTLSSTLSTELAERTFAQIIDGLPTRDDIGYSPIYSDEIANNATPSSEAMKAAKELREFCKIHYTQIDAKASSSYPGIPVACHDIAALVHDKTKPGFRRQGQSPYTILAALEGRPTDFMHEDYTAWQQYPQGISDMVGYWAEYHLFGGVVLFDRGESGVECKRALLHPVGRSRIFQLTESQILQFSKYVKQFADSPDGANIPTPFPFQAEKYAYRVDPFDSMSLNIFRNKYERIIPQDRQARCVQRLADFPDLADVLVQINNQESS
ncbi:hypothetical protein B7463_g5549, partial [Scytalidium lignicola]